MTENNLKIITTDWLTHQAELSAIRYEVFVEEQKVPKDMEIDEDDQDALHFLVVSKIDKQAVATGRMLENGHIGRMAVLKKYRNRNIGSKLLMAITDEAEKHGMTEVFLNAQISAVDFYFKNGFIARGDEFMDAGIPHIRMTKKL